MGIFCVSLKWKEKAWNSFVYVNLKCPTQVEFTKIGLQVLVVPLFSEHKHSLFGSTFIVTLFFSKQQ